MLIHSVTPPQMLMPASDLPPLTHKQITGGYLEGYDTPEGFRLSRINSTDPALYLKSELSPGRIYSEPRT